MAAPTHDGGKPNGPKSTGNEGPKGPENSAMQSRKPGLGGTNHGNCGSQGRH